MQKPTESIDESTARDIAWQQYRILGALTHQEVDLILQSRSRKPLNRLSLKMLFLILAFLIILKYVLKI